MDGLPEVLAEMEYILMETGYLQFEPYLGWNAARERSTKVLSERQREGKEKPMRIIFFWEFGPVLCKCFVEKLPNDGDLQNYHKLGNGQRNSDPHRIKRACRAEGICLIPKEGWETLRKRENPPVMPRESPHTFYGTEGGICLKRRYTRPQYRLFQENSCFEWAKCAFISCGKIEKESRAPLLYSRDALDSSV